MSALDDQVTVWQLAALTDDLTAQERGALRRVGERLEREWNKFTVGNVERRLAKVGMLDLFGPWGEQRRRAHAEWWDRFLGDAARYLPAVKEGN